MSRSTFMLFSTAYLLLGLLVSGIVSAYTSSEWTAMVHNKLIYNGPDKIMLGLGVFVGMLLCIEFILFAKSSFTKFLAYVAMTAVYGIILGPFVAMFAGATLVKAIVVTGVITFIFGLIGIVIPESLDSWLTKLLGATLVILVGMFGLPVIGWFFPFFPVKEGLSLLDWVTIVIFCGWIIHDMNRAKFVKPTMGNAIEVATGMYLNVMNIFIRILEKYGDWEAFNWDDGDHSTYSDEAASDGDSDTDTDD